MAEFAAELDACIADDTTAPRPAVAQPRRVRSGPSPWPIVLALLVLIAIGAGIGYWALHRSSGGPANGRAPNPSGGASVHLSSPTAYDPYGSPPGQENNSEAPRATDADPLTFWETEHYNATFAALGKPGVGLVLRAPQAVKLSQLGVATATPGFRAVIKAGDSVSGPFSDTVSPNIVVGGSQVFHLSVSSPHQFYVIWITQLPPGAPPLSVRINDVTATSAG
jgi:hypothetical protein